MSNFGRILGRHRGPWIAASVALLLVGGVAVTAMIVTLARDTHAGAPMHSIPAGESPAGVAAAAPSDRPDQMLFCGDIMVPARALTEPRSAADLSPEVQSVLADPLIGIDGPLSEWFIAHENAERVVILRESEEPLDLGAGDIRTHDLVAIETGAEQAIPLDPPWGVYALANCTPSIDLGSLTEASITLDPDAIPERDDDRVALLVTERACNSGRPATDRVELIELIETESTVELVIGIQPNTGGTCPSNPPTPFTIDLRQPLADRTILNAAVVPAQEITLPGL